MGGGGGIVSVQVPLNALSITIAAHLRWPLGDSTAAALMAQIDHELRSEQLKDWTLRYKEIPWERHSPLQRSSIQASSDQ